MLLDLGDEVTVERYMVVPPAPKNNGSLDTLVDAVLLIFLPITSQASLLLVSFVLSC